MKKIIEYFVTHPRVTNMTVAVVIIMGLFSAFSLNRQSNPNVSLEIMKVTTVYPGAGPEDVEINVTGKIEDQLQDVENLKRVTSMSLENLSIIFIEVDSDSNDVEKVKRNIRNAVGRVSDLPATVTQKPLVEELSTSSMPLMEIALSGDVPERELRKYTRDLESRLREVTGVGLIRKIGYRKREIKINVDLERLRENRISFNEIMHAIRARNVRTSGGTIESYVSEKKILTLSEYDNPMAAKEVIVRSNFEGYQVKLSNLAEISDDFEKPRILFRGQGEPAIGLVIQAQDNADIIDLSKELRNELARFKKGVPESISVNMIFDFSLYTRIILDMVQANGLMGFILVLVIMYLFLDIRSAFWSAFGIPLSFLGALIFFPAAGITINNITLVTLILLLGIVVDDAIVVSEKIYLLKQQGMEKLKATMNGTTSVLRPVTAAILTTMLTFAPMMFLKGIYGKFLYSIPVVVILVLSFSWLESLFILPSHVYRIDPPVEVPRRIRWLEPLKEKYTRLLTRALYHRKKVLGIFAAVFAGIMLLAAGTLSFVLDENRDIDFLVVVIEAPQGSSLMKTSSMVRDVEKLVEKSIPADILSSYTTQVGHHDLDIFGASAGQYTNWAMINIYLKPADTRNITSEAIMEQIKPDLEKLKKAAGFHRLNIQKFGGMDVGSPVHVIFTSNNDSVRNRFEKMAVDYLKTVKGVYDIETDNIPGKDVIRIRLDYSRLARMGLTAMDVGQTVRTAFDGTIVTSIRREGEDIDFRVRVKDHKRFHEKGILDLPVANREGALVPLKYFARLKTEKSRSVLHHYHGKRAVSIKAGVDTGIITSKEVNRLIREKFEEKVSAIPGLQMKLGGQEEETATSMKGYLLAFIVAVVTIYFLLVTLFNSFRQPFIILSIVPFALAGVLLTLVVHNLPVTIIAMMGLLGLVGVVVNDTIVIINHLNGKFRRVPATFEKIAQGVKERFRPVILTTLTTFAGLLPTSYGLGGDLPELRPMVLTMAWGLVFSTFVTLGFIPLVYSLFAVKRPGGEVK